MEGRDSNRRDQPRARTKGELAVEVWNRLGRVAVGAHELHAIQRAIGKRFGTGAVDSPASIARLLADEGAELRHPEVIECDARWREEQIEANHAAVLDGLISAKPLRMKQAETLIKKLEKLRKKLERGDDQRGLSRLRETAVNVRQTAQSLAKSDRLNPQAHAEQAEIAQWLAVWIRTPALFEDWLELRRRSSEFIKRFSARDTAP